MQSDLSKVLKVHDVFLVRRLVRCFSTCVAGLDVSLRYRAACYEKADEPFDLSLQQGNYPMAASASPGGYKELDCSKISLERELVSFRFIRPTVHSFGINKCSTSEGTSAISSHMGIATWPLEITSEHDSVSLKCRNNAL